MLLLQNFRPDLPITFRPALILSSGEVALAPVTLAAHTSTTVDINAALKERGLTDTRGTILVQFDFSSYGPGSAVVQMRDDKHHLSLNSYAQSSEEYWSGTTYDAVVWTPNEGTQGFVSITNTSTEAHSVRVAFLVKGRSEQQPDLLIAPRQTRILPIDGLLEQSRESGAGIHVEYTQGTSEEYTGAILVEGQLFNRKSGFAKNIHFMNKALPPTGTLRSHFVMLGRQPVEDNFPVDLSFRSMAVVRNIDSSSVTVTPTIKFLRNEALQTIKLSSRLLRPTESLLIDFNDEQKTGHLPSDFIQGSLELDPGTSRASIVGELFNFSQTGGYVVGPSFTSYPNRSTSSIWRIDGSFQTTIMIENTAAENDRVTMNLYSERGSYRKTFDVSSGKLLKINVRDLQQKGVPDDQGNLLLETSGVMSLVASHNARSKISYDKIIHSSDESDYVGLPINACDYVTVIGTWLDSTDINGAFPIMKTYYWTQSGAADAIQAGSGSSNSSVAQISNNGGGDMVTFSPTNVGQVYNVTINPPFPTENAQFCDACSGGAVSVISFSLQIELAYTAFKTDFSNPGTGQIVAGDGTKRCFGGSWCTPLTSPPDCNPSFVDQVPLIPGSQTSCFPFYNTTWLAFRGASGMAWSCFPLIPGQNAIGTTVSTLGACTKHP